MPLKILIAEDDYDDRFLTKEAFDSVDPSCNLDFVENGEDLLTYLNNQLPDLVVLDLNMPRKDGRTALFEIRADERLKALRIVVLTTSKTPDDIAYAERMNVERFFTKPSSFKELLEVVQQLVKVVNTSTLN